MKPDPERFFRPMKDRRGAATAPLQQPPPQPPQASSRSPISSPFPSEMMRSLVEQARREILSTADQQKIARLSDVISFYEEARGYYLKLVSPDQRSPSERVELVHNFTSALLNSYHDAVLSGLSKIDDIGRACQRGANAMSGDGEANAGIAKRLKPEARKWVAKQIKVRGMLHVEDIIKEAYKMACEEYVAEGRRPIDIKTFIKWLRGLVERKRGRPRGS
jgi:hypothetical protein